MNGRNINQLEGCAGYKLFDDGVSSKVFIEYDGDGAVLKLKVSDDQEGLDPVESLSREAPALVPSTSKSCTVCWSKEDVTTDYENLDVKDYYLKENIVGSHEDVPFFLDPVGLTCE